MTHQIAGAMGQYLSIMGFGAVMALLLAGMIGPGVLVLVTATVLAVVS